MESIERRLGEEPALREAYCMVVDGDGWHRGVIGITATRVVERYARPAVIVSREGAEAYGSGRSIPAFHLLNALESFHELFSRYGGHAHAVGFAMPVGNVEKLRGHLDGYARARLTLADFEPQLEFDRELPLDEVTPELQQALSLLEPFGMENLEPVFTARAVRLMAPPQTLKDKHVRLRVAPAVKGILETLSASAAPEFTPRCHPDPAAIRTRDEAGQLVERGQSAANGRSVMAGQSRAETGPFDSAQGRLRSSAAIDQADSGSASAPSWRSNVTFKAMGWGLKECCERLQLLAGDRLDIAYTVGINDHPEFGGLELTLRDIMRTL